LNPAGKAMLVFLCIMMLIAVYVLLRVYRFTRCSGMWRYIWEFVFCCGRTKDERDMMIKLLDDARRTGTMNMSRITQRYRKVTYATRRQLTELLVKNVSDSKMETVLKWSMTANSLISEEFRTDRMSYAATIKGIKLFNALSENDKNGELVLREDMVSYIDALTLGLYNCNAELEVYAAK
jgi:hypothetical protein